MQGDLFTYLGKRETQEDFAIASPNFSINIVCDGVGGRPDGEKASEFIASTLFEKLIQIKKSDWPLEIAQLIIESHAELKNYLESNNYSSHASTTLAVLLIYNGQVLAAHVGDSRGYHFYNDNNFRRTKDHSRVQDLLDVGALSSEDEARNHKMSNLITKAIGGEGILRKQDVRLTRFDLEMGINRFLLCTDGVIEAFDDHALNDVLGPSKGKSFKTCIDNLIEDIHEVSRDNSTFILIEHEYSQQTMLDKIKRLFK